MSENSVTGAIATIRPTLSVLLRFDRSKVTQRSILTAVQNAAGVFAPLAVGAASGHLLLGLAAAIGALNVAFSDRPGPYGVRAGRMLAATAAGSISAAIGGVAGQNVWLSVALIGLWGFGGGMLVVFGPAAEQIGVTSILLLVVYGGFGVSPQDALVQAALIFAGGLAQTGLSVAAWPLRPRAPERQILGLVFEGLAEITRSRASADSEPPLTAQITDAQRVLTGMVSARGREAEAFRIMLDEAERVRLELIALLQYRELFRERGLTPRFAADLDRLWSAAADLLDGLAAAVRTEGATSETGELRRAEEAVADMRAAFEEEARRDPVMAEILGHADALLGQLRACLDLSGRRSEVDIRSRTSELEPVRSRPFLADSIATVRANAGLGSASFRHAVRLAVTLAVAAALARQFDLSRSYWVPMTVAIVLKPDFTSTISRGILRIAGTLLGLIAATELVHLVGGNLAARVILVGVLTLAIRSLGPANFGVSATAVTALVVLLVSFAGTSPESTIHYRGVDTILGGLLSLAAYAIWPTWERSHVGDYLAVMLDAYRRYFDAVMEAYIGVRRPPPAEMTAFRLEARLARSNAEASIDRLRSEPAGSAQEGAAMSGVLASSHRFAQAAMRIEASLYTRTDGLVPATLDGFVRDVDTTLEHLSADLRHRALAGRSGEHNDASTCGQGVDLRQDQNALMDEARLRARDGAPLLMETERIANSLNTIRDVLRQAAGTTSSPQPNESGARSGESVA